MDFFIGQIILLPYNFEPYRMIPCNGQILNINEHTALWSLIGFNYGGTPEEKTFGIPDLRGKEPGPFMKYYIVDEGVYPQRG